MDVYVPLTGQGGYVPKNEDGIINLMGSRMYKPFFKPLSVLERMKVHRIKKQMLYAAKKGLMFHLWWHPHNIGIMTEYHLKQLEEILCYYDELREKYNMRSLNMREAAEEMLDYKGCGMSVMEMSHRSKMFQQIIDEAEQDIRDLMNIPDNYKVLFLQGGASQQFAAVPMNLKKNGKAAYIVTGQWAKKAAAEAEKYLEVQRVASSADKTFSYIPDCSDLDIDDDVDYVYICENNTIYGTKYHELPNTKGHTLVADVSSCFLSEPVDVSKYGVIYGGVQKNVGPAGVVIAIIREDLIPEEVDSTVPTMLQWKTQADAGSLYNTPPCYGIYICGKVFKWIKKMGGLDAMKKRNEEKAKILYDFLDNSKLFKGTVVPKDRSLMNVPFVTGNEELDAKFVAEAKAAGLENLKGHRTVGGMRASIYNAMPIEGVKALVEFMEKFEKENA